ncbi:Fatty acid desaturase [Posidoniimonas polymericola]|uniref:Fatty acid desaturase n=1 Tax=Posidoniimonas polymericola TaxID=2528002 RepID=A0A5C5YSS5_9BACT|nr:acyl-CoA desaturase [Posidoniimonas polymericola]TWT77968.1 Fatty acid desaturase [Posidoniimonas polymericola]
MSVIPTDPVTAPPKSKRVKPVASAKVDELSHPSQQANTRALWSRGLDWPVVIWIIAVHSLAVMAPFYFSWQALATCVVLILMTGSLGVCMGYHRLLTHGSFKTYKPVRWLLAFLGGLSGEGSALTWVANHRKHHAFSDHDGDPHSPRHGAIWSHITWFFPNRGMKWQKEILQRYAPDIMKDKMMIVLHKLFLPTHVVCGLVLFAVGYFGTAIGLGGLNGGLSMLAWGTGIRMLYVFHVTWFVNSISHMWGYRNYETTDDSRNNWLVGLLAFGEGWHNNHHAYQRVASQGHKWWEVDPTYWMILLMEKTGLAWDVVRLKDVIRTTKPA